MPDIKITATMEVSPQRVYEAITEQMHLAAWWTPTCTAEPRERSEARFEFDDEFLTMHIDVLTPQKVTWTCTGSEMRGVDEWKDTHISFQLTKNAEGNTNLVFNHTNWKDKTKLYELCTDGWTHFITDSLKSYLEQGVGKPYMPKAQ